ncbi:MAG: 50S ribosomal protein L25/general stress protein Ctc [Gammaproteobacteria bacterium]
MSLFEVIAEERTDMGKGASRRLRRTGLVPIVVYGGDNEPQSLSLSHNEVLKHLAHEPFYSSILTLKEGSNSSKVILRDVQRHPSKPVVLHMDFLRVDANKPIRVQVPLHFIGEDIAPGAKAGGNISHDLTDIAIEVLPGDLPEYIEVDISALEIGDSVHLSDLKVSGSAIIVELAKGEGHDQPVASIHAPRAAEEEPVEDADAPAAEGGDDAAASDEGDSE